MELIHAEKIHVTLGSRPVLRDIGLTLQRGEVLGLIGPNGSGKSTLLRALMGLIPRKSGDIRIMDKALEQFSREELARRMAYMPQGATCHWPLPVERVVALGRIPHASYWNGLGSRDHEIVQKAMAVAEVSPFAYRPVTQLSFGERLRVLLARALAVEAPMLLADEPVASLDPGHQIQVMELLNQLALEGHGVLVVLHELTLAARFCHRLVLLHEGQILRQGLPRDVLSAEALKQAYGITAQYGQHEDEFFVMPWRRS